MVESVKSGQEGADREWGGGLERDRERDREREKERKRDGEGSKGARQKIQPTAIQYYQTGGHVPECVRIPDRSIYLAEVRLRDYRVKEIEGESDRGIEKDRERERPSDRQTERKR